MNVKNNHIYFFQQVGGNMGFGLGLSFVSVAEIFYWFTVRLYRSYNMRKDSKS